MSKRAHIPDRQLLAACIRELFQIPYIHAKFMTADQIRSLVHFDHSPLRKVDGGPDRHWNLVPVLIKDHLEKTAKIDMPEIAKDRRIEKDWRGFMRAIQKGTKPPKRKSKWRSKK